MSDVEEYIKTEVFDEADEEGRESLNVIASLGTTKELLGVEMTLGDIKRLTDQDIEKNITSGIKWCQARA